MHIADIQRKLRVDRHLLGFKGVKEVPNVHPLFVHFPIALYPMTLMFYVAGVLTGKQCFLRAGRVSLYLAVLAGVLTAVTGVRAKNSIPFNATIGNMIDTHEKIGITIGTCSAVLAAWDILRGRGLPKDGLPFLAVLAFVNYLVLQNSDIGSDMVYVQGAAVKPATEAVLA